MNIELNGEEAYRAAYEFLDILFKITPSDGLASFLGDMSTLVDGKPADPEFWGDWLECIQKAKSGKVDTSLNIGMSTDRQ